MSNAEFGSLTIFLFFLLAAARIFGHLFTRLKQPKVVGEIFAGVLLGPSLLGYFAPSLSAKLVPAHGASAASSSSTAVLFFLYNFGLLLLMFASGAETKGLFNREDRRQVAWLGALGTGIPLVAALCVLPFIPLGMFAGRVHARIPLILVISIAVAVTSIPVISKIFHDLNILHTRFARLVLGVAVIEDIVLWAVLAIATALAESGSIPNRKIAIHVGLTLRLFRARTVRWPSPARAHQPVPLECLDRDIAGCLRRRDPARVLGCSSSVRHQSCVRRVSRRICGHCRRRVDGTGSRGDLGSVVRCIYPNLLRGCRL